MESDSGATTSPSPDPERGTDFIRQIVAEDLASGRVDQIATRFPPEPNGFLHIGHAKAICIDFGVARENGGVCNLRFDDTNPETEDARYVEAIQRDIRWLGFEWDNLRHASDYFERLHDWAVELIRSGKAYVGSLSGDEIREYRGTITEPGRDSPHRDRTVEENLDLFARMRAGEFPDGAHVLRAKIDMAHPNMKMRDPVMYRIRHASHYRASDTWCIYPLYDWAHGQSDAIEGITHSLCSLEFVSNRELYDWYTDALELPEPRPRQFEFARLNLAYTITSKRKLLELVEGGHVAGWDDPRMPTLSGLRRRGVTPEAVRTFCELAGVAKSDNRVDVAMLEYTTRDDLNHKAPRVMCVLRPLKVVITNYPEGQSEEFDASYWPHDVPKEGSRKLPFSRELWIERDDFMEDPPKKFFRLAPGREVRLRYAYVIRCDEVVKDADGDVVELRCSYDPSTRGGSTPEGRKIKGTIHWVSAPYALVVQVRLYDRLFSVPDPDTREDDFKEYLNPGSLDVVDVAYAEPSLADAEPRSHFQFERLGYFFTDPEDSRPGAPVFNRTVTLRDAWARIAAADTASSQSDTESRSHVPGVTNAEREPRGPTRAQIRAADRAADLNLAEIFDRYVELGLSAEDADLLVLDKTLGPVFDEALEAMPENASAAKIAGWVINEVARLDSGSEEASVGAAVDGARLASVVGLVESGSISRAQGRSVLLELSRSNDSPAAIVDRLGLEQISDSASLEPIVDRLLEQFADKATAYRGGRTGLLGFFVGQVMQTTKGKANAEHVTELLRARLDG